MAKKKKVSITKLKRELALCKKDFHKIESEMLAYKRFATTLFKQSLTNLEKKEYTPAQVHIKSIQQIWHDYGTPFISWGS